MDIAKIVKNVQYGSEATLWSGDKRYRDTPQLAPGMELVIADIEGPAVITLLRIAKMPAHVFGDLAKYTELNRAIVLEITYDDETVPAVRCPLADFFGDGCNGSAMEFSTPFIELVPSAYNCYIPMPFAKRAKVVVRNDSKTLTWHSYYVVEWQKLPAWDPSLGYFHASWKREGFFLHQDVCKPFLELEGSGHVIGRQFSVATDAPSYRNFNFVMEGNNEVTVDGRDRVIEWLGSEDSFTFSWGFHHPYVGLRAGMPYVDTEESRDPRFVGAPAERSRLSIYRFHDHMPVRFDRSLIWWIDWSNETFGPQMGWVDYAAVFYWYHDRPLGFTHPPLMSVPERCLDILPEPGEANA